MAVEKTEVDAKSNKEFGALLESIAIIAKKSGSKQEFLAALARIRATGETRPQK